MASTPLAANFDTTQGSGTPINIDGGTGIAYYTKNGTVLPIGSFHIYNPIQYGAVGDGVTDDYPAFAAMLAAIPERGGSIFIPGGYYFRLSQKLIFTRHIRIFGEGWSQNPGNVGGVIYAGVNAYTGSILVYDADMGGLQFLAFTDHNANAPAFQYQSSYNSSIRDVMFYSLGGVGITNHGIESRTLLDMENVRIEGFAGCGLYTIANDAGAVLYGSSDGGCYKKVSSRFNKLHGFFFTGNDANVNHFDTCDAGQNGGVGYLEKSAFGNTYTSCHAATNNQSFGTPAGYSAAQRAQNIADWAGLAVVGMGSYVTTSAVGAHVFNGCYTEGGNGSTAEIVAPAIVDGGNLAFLASHTAASTATRFNAYQILNIREIYADTTGAIEFFVPTSAKFTNNTGNITVILNGSGVFSNLQLQGAGSTANGLDILAGLTASYFSCNAFTFRNAAQSVNFATIDGNGISILQDIAYAGIATGGRIQWNSISGIAIAGVGSSYDFGIRNAASASVMLVPHNTTQALFLGDVNITAGQSLLNNGTKVVGAQGAAVADSAAFTSVNATVAAASPPTKAEFDAFVAEFNKLRTDTLAIRTQLNLALARIRAATGHGLIA